MGRILRGGPRLKGATLRSWEGDPEDQGPPSGDSSRWVRLTPSPLASSPATIPDPIGRPVYAMPFAVDVETSTPGSNVGDSMRLWGAILDAIFPADPTARGLVDARLDLFGVSTITVIRPGWAAPSGDPPRCDGTGRLEVLIYVGT